MNRTDRLLAIVLDLQRSGWQRAEDLAAVFGVSKRTIYRDIDALGEAGVPVVSSPGQGFSLTDGYFLPPLSFTAEEAALLLLGADVVGQHFDAGYQRAAAVAAQKIAAALPERVRAGVAALRDSVRFVQPSLDDDLATLRLLRRAIFDQRRVWMRYHGRQHQAAIDRTVDPYTLTHVNGGWILAGYCHVRHDIRYFRLDRIESLRLTTQTFARPAMLPGSPNERDDRTIVVRVLFDARQTRWVREARSYYTVSEDVTPDGLLVTLRVRREDDVVGWLLGWGSAAVVIEPETLARRIAAAANDIVRRYAVAIAVSHPAATSGDGGDP